jgi:hypothetical protein
LEFLSDLCAGFFAYFAVNSFLLVPGKSKDRYRKVRKGKAAKVAEKNKPERPLKSAV